MKHRAPLRLESLIASTSEKEEISESEGPKGAIEKRLLELKKLKENAIQKIKDSNMTK